MTEIVLKVEALEKSFGGVHATDNVDLDVHKNEIHAIIGPNGAGKTTLISQLAGALMCDEGHIAFAGSDITRLSPHKRSQLGLARSFQITSVFLNMPVLTNVSLAVQSRQGHSYRFWKSSLNDPALTEPAKAMLEKVNLSGRHDAICRELSHGEHRQLEIAMALATEPTMLLLDEPMAGMGPEESHRMIDTLKQLKGDMTILLIEHDMDAVFALADRVTVLVYGRVIASGTPDEIRNNEDVRHAYLGEETGNA